MIKFCACYIDYIVNLLVTLGNILYDHCTLGVMKSHTEITLSVTTNHVQISARACEKVASDLGLAEVAAGNSVLLNH